MPFYGEDRERLFCGAAFFRAPLLLPRRPPCPFIALGTTNTVTHTPLLVSSVEETMNDFLGLWPHRYDYIWAEHTSPHERPQWQTESRHPLSDRLILQGGLLYGVRFNSTTRYILLDIDKGSRYHPSADPQALRRIQDALEPLGLPSCLIITSSYSGGLHLYFPFEESQKSWEIALGVTTLLENSGLKSAPGQLEVFPNPRTYAPPDSGKISLYAAHRLPLQAGSYILGSDFEPIYSSRERFTEMWHQVASHNAVSSELLKQTLKSARRREYRVTTKAEKFLNDLNAEIEPGWTEAGMTNRIVGRITMRSYIFGHILYAQAPLEGDALVADIIKVARALPGFYEWSNHVNEIEEKATAWARAIEQSHYYHYGVDKAPKTTDTSDSLSYNEEKAKTAREKIRLAIAALLDEGQLPITVRERFIVLTNQFSIGGATLYKNKDLWHPGHLHEAAPVEIPPHPPTSQTMLLGQERFEALSPKSHPNLLEEKDGNTLSDKELSGVEKGARQPEVCNPSEAQLSFLPLLSELAIAQQQRRQRQAEEHSERHKIKQQAAHQAMIDRMKGYLASGDPILMGEALNWLRVHPECGDQVL